MRFIKFLSVFKFQRTMYIPGETIGSLVGCTVLNVGDVVGRLSGFLVGFLDGVPFC